MRVLLVEDQPALLKALRQGLEEEGFAVDVAPDGEEADQKARTSPYDVIVLDIMLPKIDGLTLLKRWRESGMTSHVLMLTAKGTLDDRVHGLDTGADDYLTKPFELDELLARIHLRLRSDAAGSDASAMVLSHGDLSLDLRTRRALVAGRSVDLTAREFTLAETFLRNPGHVLSREQLLSGAWGYDFDPGSNVVDVYVRYLRRKLGAEFFETVRGMGYRLV